MLAVTLDPGEFGELKAAAVSLRAASGEWRAAWKEGGLPRPSDIIHRDRAVVAERVAALVAAEEATRSDKVECTTTVAVEISPCVAQLTAIEGSSPITTTGAAPPGVAGVIGTRLAEADAPLDPAVIFWEVTVLSIGAGRVAPALSLADTQGAVLRLRGAPGLWADAEVAAISSGDLLSGVAQLRIIDAHPLDAPRAALTEDLCAGVRALADRPPALAALLPLTGSEPTHRDPVITEEAGKTGSGATLLLCAGRGRDTLSLYTARPLGAGDAAAGVTDVRKALPLHTGVFIRA